MMKTEVYKQNFERFRSVKQKDSTFIGDREFHEYRNSKKHPLFSEEKVYTDPETFKENFGNPMYEILFDYTMVVVEEIGPKVSLKLFYGFKHRRPGLCWFKVSKNVDFITVNKDTGDIYVGHIHGYQKKRKCVKRITRNYLVSNPISNFQSKLKNTLLGFTNNHSAIALDVMEKFMNRICEPIDNMSKNQRILKFYLDKKGIKYPNNFWVFSEFMWGDKYRKTLKKNGKKLVDTFMELWGLNGKKIKKCLHTTQSLNIGLYNHARGLFGDDWLNQDEKIILDIFDSNVSSVNTNEYDIKNIASHEEIKRIFSAFKSVVRDFSIDYWTFNDHLRMYYQLKGYGEVELKWTADGSDYKKFQNEHLDWTDKLEHYRKGTYTRIYPSYFYSEIEKEIQGYFPIILDTSEKYNKESSIQSNCVKGYIGRPGSFIVSLRKYNADSEERATVEYRITKQGQILDICRVQTLGRFNNPLDNSWNEPLDILDKIISECFQRKNFVPVKIEKKCVNGVLLKSGSEFDDKGYLKWTERNKNIIYDEWY